MPQREMPEGDRRGGQGGQFGGFAGAMPEMNNPRTAPGQNGNAVNAAILVGLLLLLGGATILIAKPWKK
jgi:hypothetical protein